MEKIQRMATKMIKYISNRPYKKAKEKLFNSQEKSLKTSCNVPPPEFRKYILSQTIKQYRKEEPYFFISFTESNELPQLLLQLL